MSLKLLPPGTRKGNRYWLLRGRIRGKQHEYSSGRTDLTPAEAEEWRIRMEAYALALEAQAEAESRVVTFADAARRYIAHRKPARDQERWVLRLIADPVGALPLEHVHNMDLADAANRLCPHVSNATKNRQVFIPAAAVLHYAAKSGHCPWMRVELLPVDRRSKPRPAGVDTLAALIDATRLRRPDLWRLLTGLSYQGWRISEFLSMQWSDVLFAERRVLVRVGKARTWKSIPLHPAFEAALRTVPEAERRGKVFPWSTRWGVYRALRPILEETGLRFTPHMARHQFATDLNTKRFTLEDIKAAGSWTTVEAIGRYIEVSEGRAREVLAELPERKRS